MNSTIEGKTMNRLLGIAAAFLLLDGCIFADQQPGYVILTTTNIVSNSTQLTNFVAAREARGFSATVVDNRSVANGGWGGDSGDAAAENIRQWLIDNHTNGCGDVVIDYVLLLGNPHPTTGDVPMKLCFPLYPDTDPDGTNGVPTDLYYANMYSDWDVNANERYGQWADLDTDPPPWIAEFAVGRIPYYGNMSDLDAILLRTIEYESEDATTAAWRKNVLLPFDEDAAGGYGDWWYTLLPSRIGEKIRTDVLVPAGWPYHRIYDTTSNAIPETLNCIASNVVQVLTSNSFGLVLWFCHGTDTSTYGHVLDTSHAEDLNLDHPIITFQASCRNAYPETTNNLAYTLLKDSGVATVGHTRISKIAVSFYPASNNDFVLGFGRNMVLYGLGAGDALSAYKANNAPEIAGRWKNVVGYTVYGCPAVGLFPFNYAGPVFSF